MKLGKKILVMLGLILTLTIVAGAIYASNIYSFSTDELAKTFKDYRSKTSKNEDVIKQTKPFSILLMGVDTGSADRTSKWEGNSDSMILVTINPETKKTTLTSLERDILVELTGPEDNGMNGAEAKLNAAYATGGAQMALMTVEKMLNVQIDRYMQINMEGLVQLVDAVGGIEVTNTFDFPISIEENEPAYTATVEPGTHHINGEQALVYARMRYDDPEGDYGRQRRQREVITKVLKKILALDSVGKYKDILRAVSGNMQTDIEISTKTIPSLLGYRDSLKTVKTYQLRGEDATINGGSYQLVTSAHMLEVQNRIKKDLNQTVNQQLSTNAILYENFTGEESTVVPIPESSYSNQVTEVAPADYAPAQSAPTAPTASEQPLVSNSTPEVPVETVPSLAPEVPVPAPSEGQ